MNYKSYQHIEKLGTSDTEGILNGTCYLTYKIDGTNGCIWLTDNKTLGFGSRKRELSLVDDNAGFMNLISNDTSLSSKLLSYLLTHPNYIIYGEWLVPHTIKRYNQDSWRKFYVFDVYDTETERYINYDIWTKEFDILGLNYIPLIAKLENPTVEDISALLEKTGDYLITEGLGEGIVIKNYDFVNKYGHIKWAKMLTEDFRKTKSHMRKENAVEKAENLIEHNIILLMTPEHINKEYNKLIEMKGDWSSKYIFELLNRVFNEFWRDNWEIILKKFHQPTINFKVLKSYSDKYVKEVLNL